MEHPFLVFLDHTQRRSIVGRTPLDEWSARRRDLYLTTHDTHNRQISMPPVGFEPTISAGERPQTYALDRVATGTGGICKLIKKILRRADHSPRGVIPNVVHRCVWSRNLKDEEAMTRVGSQRHKKKIRKYVTEPKGKVCWRMCLILEVTYERI